MTFTAAELQLLSISDRIDDREERKLRDMTPVLMGRQEAVRQRREQREAKRLDYQAQAANRLAQQAYRRAQQKQEAKARQEVAKPRPEPTWHRSQILKLIREQGSASLTVIEDHFRRLGATRLPREIEAYLERLEKSGDIILDRTTWTGVAVGPRQ